VPSSSLIRVRPSRLGRVSFGPSSAAWLLLIGATSAVAQDSTTVRGRVIDALTSQAVAGAVVTHLGSARATTTDGHGDFTLTLELQSSYPLRIEQLGYETSQLLLPSTTRTDFTTISLMPKPLELRGLEVVTDRFAERRRFSFLPVDVLGPDVLATTHGTAYDIVKNAIPAARMCADDMGQLCIYRRRVREVSVCIDEMKVYRGALELDRHRTLQPWSWGCS
jgi:Carboxypeptidase regulatory-like domain